MKLAQLQASFQEHVLRGTDGIHAQVISDARAGVPLRLGVYTGAYTARLLEVLAESFPALRSSVGEPEFARRVGAFVRANPSRVRSARDYGEQLPGWLAQAGGGPRERGLADLARFEWAIAGAFDAPDQPALTPRGLAVLAPEDWPRLRFEFTPSLRRVDVSTNAVAWWRCACATGPRPSRWRTTCVQHWLVWRQEFAVRYRRLSRAETQALDAARSGATFAQLCTGRTALEAATMLHGWVTAGLVS